MENGLVKVVSPIDDTPAYKAGIESGDMITHIDNEPVMGLTLSEAVEKMRGPVDTKIELRLLRKGKDEPFDVSLNRAVIKISPVRARVEGDIAYVRLTTFNEQTSAEMRERVEALRRADRRPLPGPGSRPSQQPGRPARPGGRGRRRLIDKGEIVSTRGRRADTIQRFNARAGDIAREQADGGADQRRLGLGLGDRGRRSPGPSPRHRDGHPVLRQGLGPDHHADLGRRCHPPDHRPLLHAGRHLHPGQGHLAGHRGPPGQCRVRGRHARAARGGPAGQAAERPAAAAAAGGARARCWRPAAAAGWPDAAADPADPAAAADGRDYQLSRALDLLRGIALYEGRTPGSDRG